MPPHNSQQPPTRLESREDRPRSTKKLHEWTLPQMKRLVQLCDHWKTQVDVEIFDRVAQQLEIEFGHDGPTPTALSCRNMLFQLTEQNPLISVLWWPKVIQVRILELLELKTYTWAEIAEILRSEYDDFYGDANACLQRFRVIHSRSEYVQPSTGYMSDHTPASGADRQHQTAMQGPLQSCASPQP